MNQFHSATTRNANYGYYLFYFLYLRKKALANSDTHTLHTTRIRIRDMKYTYVKKSTRQLNILIANVLKQPENLSLICQNFHFPGVNILNDLILPWNMDLCFEGNLKSSFLI